MYIFALVFLQSRKLVLAKFGFCMFMKIKKISKNTFIVAQGWFSAFDSITCGQVKTRLLESQAE